MPICCLCRTLLLYSLVKETLLHRYHCIREPTFVTCLCSSTPTLWLAFPPWHFFFCVPGLVQLSPYDLVWTVLLVPFLHWSLLVLLSCQSYLIPFPIPDLWTCLEGIFRFGVLDCFGYVLSQSLGSLGQLIAYFRCCCCFPNSNMPQFPKSGSLLSLTAAPKWLSVMSVWDNSLKAWLLLPSSWIECSPVGP